MKLTTTTTLLLALLSLLHHSTHAQSTNITYLTAPALVTRNNRTIIQCWRLASAFSTSSTPGTVGAQAAVVSNATNLGTSRRASFACFDAVDKNGGQTVSRSQVSSSLLSNYLQHNMPPHNRLID